MNLKVSPLFWELPVPPKANSRAASSMSFGILESFRIPDMRRCERIIKSLMVRKRRHDSGFFGALQGHSRGFDDAKA